MKFLCKNCSLAFEADSALICPRCSAKSPEKTPDKRFEKDEERTFAGDKIVYSTTHRVFSESKEGWMSFHQNELRVCTDCGGAEFEFNWKRKEKTCSKCGSVFPLARRVK